MQSIFSDNLTAQQIFDHVVVQLALQGGPSTVDGACAYRGEGGRKCGVGFLLTDEEVGQIGNTLGIKAYGAILPTRLRLYSGLLDMIQWAHDRAATALSFKTAVSETLKAVADDFGLKKGVLYAAFPDPSAPEQKPAPDAETRKIVAALEKVLTDWVYNHGTGSNGLQEAFLEPFPERYSV